MTTEEIRHLLQQAGLRYTRQRAEVLQVYEDKKVALSQPEIEKELDDSFDRITLYRILRSFEANGLMHKVLDDGGVQRFALCSERCSDAHHQHEHVHFKCISCEQITCLEDIEIPAIKLPEGYQYGESKLLVEGKCRACAHH